MKSLLVACCIAASPSVTSGFVFVPKGNGIPSMQRRMMPSSTSHITRRTSTALQMVDQNVIMGAGIAVAGLAAGVGLVAFTEAQGERSKQRGGGLSDNMSTQLAGKLMEDIEVSSVSDLGSLTSQLEAALKESGGAEADELKMTEEEKKRIAEEADDGW